LINSTPGSAFRRQKVCNVPRTSSRLALHHRLVLLAARLLLTLRHRRLVRDFRRVHGYLPDPARPRSYVEKILWRKLFDRNPRFVTFTDKLAAKAYTAERLPELPLPETLWTGKRLDEAPAALLAGPIVLKANNGCGTNVIVEDGKPGAEELVARGRELMAARWRRDEWAYGQIEPMLFLEQWLPLDTGTMPMDIKVYIACGIPANVWTADRKGQRSLTLDPEGNPVPGRDSGYPREDQALPFSPQLGALAREAAALAPVLAEGIDFLRVDFLVSGGRLYAGELTVYSSSGTERLANRQLERRLTHLWDLRESHFLRQRHGGLKGLYANALRAAESDRMSGHPQDISAI